MNGIVLNCLQSHYNTVQKNNNKEGSKKEKFYKAKHKFVGVLDMVTLFFGSGFKPYHRIVCFYKKTIWVNILRENYSYNYKH